VPVVRTTVEFAYQCSHCDYGYAEYETFQDEDFDRD
jgi:rubredoxin